METIAYATSLLEEIPPQCIKEDDDVKNEEETEFYTGDKIIVLNFSKKELLNTDSLTMPLGLTHLNLSHNKLFNVPEAILKLEHLQELDLSFNFIEFFDSIPSFCFAIQHLNLSNNNLKGPPYWVWSKSPKNLIQLDLSNNKQMTHSFCLDVGYFQELLLHKCLAIDIKIHNCGLLRHIEILSTFSNVRQLQLGEFIFNYKYANQLPDIPSQGLEQCCNLETINLSNNLVNCINANITLLMNLVEIDLSQNRLRDLPNEFCELKKLEVCILSHNYLLYLPDNFVKLSKLRCLKLNSNDFYMLPANLTKLGALKHLDMYENALYEVPEDIYKLQELDVAQNYFDEPVDKEYLLKRDKLRSYAESDRVNGRKPEPINYESEHTASTDDDEAYMNSLQNTENHEHDDAMSSSSEDWDSDDYWIPHNFERTTSSTEYSWLCYVKRKMAEGNFCPMDAHETAISDIVKYDQICNPPVIYESEGQFDDYSEDDS